MTQTLLEVLEHVIKSFSRVTACRNTCKPIMGWGPPQVSTGRIHGETTEQNCGNLPVVSVESTADRKSVV